MPDWMRAFIHATAQKTLGTDIQEVQDRIASAAKRPLLRITCDHQEWDHTLYVCRRCGATAQEIILKPEQFN